MNHFEFTHIMTKTEMSYEELKEKFWQFNSNGGLRQKPLQGAVLISETSFHKKYSTDERTYVFSSNNKAFIPGMGGYSIFACNLTGDDSPRLEAYIENERGSWEIEKCWFLESPEDVNNNVKQED